MPADPDSLPEAPACGGRRRHLAGAAVALARGFRRGLVAGLGLGLGVACGGAAATDGPDRPLEVVVATEPQTLDPRFATRSLDVKLTRLVHLGLARLEPDTLEPVPGAAESLEQIDERTVEVTLRSGLRFHGGGVVSSEDVCATLAALGDPSLGSPHRVVVGAIARCEPLGPARVRLRLSAPRASILSDLEVPILRADQAALPPARGGELDGLGPFRVVAREQSSLRLERVAAGGETRGRRAVVVRTVRDENARVERLLAGQSDVAPGGISPALLPALAASPGLEVVARHGANVTYLMFQNDRPSLRSAGVRQALAHRIDRTLLVRTLLAGRARVASGMLPPGHWAAPAPLAPSAPASPLRDPRALGRLTLLTGTDRLRVAVGRAIAQMLGDGGFEVELQPLELGVLLARLDAGEFDLAVLQLPELTEPNVLSWFLHPRGVPGEGGEGKNRARYRSAEAAALLDRAASVADRRVRRELYGSLEALLARDLPVFPLWHEDQIAVVSARARGFVPGSEGRLGALAALP